MKNFLFLPVIACGLVLFGAGCLSSPSTNIQNFTKSINYDNQATKLLNASSATDQDLYDAIQYQQQALEVARLVDTEKLNEAYATFGDHYKSEFIAGLEVMINGYNNRDNNTFLEGQVILDQWGSWYEENIDKIRSL